MAELPSLATFLARAAQECGFEREKFVDSKLPSDFDKVVVILFLGDMRAISILSMLLFSPFRDNLFKDKYVIMCSYPGMSSLFPKADEYWSVSDGLAISSLMQSASGFGNKEKKAESLGIQLRRRFYTVITGEDFLPYYDNGLTTAFFERFKQVDRFLPQIPNWRGNEFSMFLSKKGGHGIFIYPGMQGRCWDRGREVVVDLSKDFWVKLTERLIGEGYTPVVYQNQASYDISPHFGEQCFYCSDRNFLVVFAAMRSAGCVLDVFSGISRLAIIARCPFLAMDERQRYIKSKEFEVNDLCINRMYPYRYVFSFPTVVGGSQQEIINHLINVANKFIPEAAKSDLPPLSESYEEVPYDIVRQHKAKKLGIHFIKVERLVIP